MTVENQDITITSGDSKNLDTTVENQDAGDDTPLDLSGATIEYVIATRQGGSVVVEKDNQATGGVTVDPDPTTGYLEIDIDPGDTADLDADNYHHELEVEDNVGNVSTVMRGTLTVVADTT